MTPQREKELEGVRKRDERNGVLTGIFFALTLIGFATYWSLNPPGPKPLYHVTVIFCDIREPATLSLRTDSPPSSRDISTIFRATPSVDVGGRTFYNVCDIKVTSAI